MIIKTKKGTYISDTDGMLLTDGMSYGLEYDLGEGRSKDELSEVTREEYASSVSGNPSLTCGDSSPERGAIDTFSNSFGGEGSVEVM